MPTHARGNWSGWVRYVPVIGICGSLPFSVFSGCVSSMLPYGTIAALTPQVHNAAHTAVSGAHIVVVVARKHILRDREYHAYTHCRHACSLAVGRPPSVFSSCSSIPRHHSSLLICADLEIIIERITVRGTRAYLV